MKQHSSVFMLFVKSSFYKVLLLLLAMIAAEGYLQYKKGNFADLNLNASAVVPLK